MQKIVKRRIFVSSLSKTGQNVQKRQEQPTQRKQHWKRRLETEERVQGQ